MLSIGPGKYFGDRAYNQFAQAKIRLSPSLFSQKPSPSGRWLRRLLTLYPKSLKRSFQSSPSSRPIREVLSPISFKEDAPNAQPSPNSERRGPGREERELGLGNPERTDAGGGWTAWARSPVGNPPGTMKTLTNILVEGVGGKERHVRCVPRCPQGLPSTPQHSRCDGERGPLRYKNSQGICQCRVLLSPSSHPPPATEAAAAATAEKLNRPPRGACRESRRLERCLNAACSSSN